MMANEGGGKIKMKRPGDQTKPYGRRASLFGKVTDTVKDMLSPSWLVDLVQSVKKKTPPPGIGSEHPQPMRNHYMHNDGSSFIQSDMNRVGLGGMASDIGRFHIGGSGNEVNNTNSNDNSNSFTSAQLPLNNYRPTFASYPQVNEHSEYSASTGGSLAPQLDQQRQGPLQPNTHYNIEMNTSHTHQGQNRRMSDNSFLWSKSQPVEPQANRSHKPSFNISAFGSNPASPDSSLFGSSYHKSPYYPGKTTFGGAAAHRKSRQHSPTPYQLTPQRKTVTARPVNKSEASSVTSSTAKRILDTLERMSTPLSDAKKIPSYSNDLDSSLSFTPATYRRSSLSRSSSLREQNKNGPPISRRSTPSLASIATNRQPITSRKQPVTTDDDVTSDDKATKTNNNNDEYFKQIPMGGGSRKMKQERGGKHYSNKPVEDDEYVEAPVLPTEFTLPVVAPSFNFLAPATSANKSESPAPEKQNVFSPMTQTTSPSNSSEFTFASPIAKVDPGQSNGVPVTSPKTFQFSSPMAVDDSKDSDRSSSPVTSGFKFNSTATPTFNVKPRPKQFTPNGGPSFDAPADTGGGLKPAVQLKSGSVMDFLGKSSKPAAELKSGSVMDLLGKKPNGSTSGLAPASEMKSGSVMDALGKGTSEKSDLSSLFKKPSGSWNCDVCMVQNKTDVDKCVACETPKPKAKPATPAVMVPAMKSSGGDLGSLFKKPSGSWNCDVCMVQNKTDVNKCVACETPKPGAKPAAPSVMVPTGKSSGGDLGSLFKKPSGSWNCDVCMVQNKTDVEKCVACETPKPGAKPSNSLKTDSLNSSSKPATSISAPKVTGTGFNLPKKASGTWDCDTCFVSNKGESLKCVACQTPKPGAKPTTGFTSSGGFKFGLNNADTSAPSATTTTASTSGFKFGSNTDSATTAPSSGGFKFGAATSTEDKTQTPASTFKFGVSTVEKDSSTSAAPGGGFKFGATGAAATSNEKSTVESSAPPSGGFKFNVASTTGSDSIPTTSKVETKTTAPSTGGFKLGVQEMNKESGGSSGGFTFGQKAAESDTKKSDGPSVLKSESAAVAPLSSGFAFGAGSTSSGGQTEKTEATKPATGISFSAPTATKANPKPEFKPVFGSAPEVTFGAKKPDAPAAAATTTTTSAATSLFQFKPATTTSSIGGSAPTIGFSAGPLGGAPSGGMTNPGAVPIFNLSSGSTEVKASPLKRGRDDVDGASDAKKSTFNFTGATKPAAGPSDIFKFGAAATTTNGSSMFTFSANKSTTSASSGFGGPTTTTTSASSSFGTSVFGGFSGNSNSQPIGGFGGNSSSQPAGGFGSNGKPSNVFGGNSQSSGGFGSSNSAAPFGGSSSTLTFSGTPPVTTAAPVFGAPTANSTPAFGAPSVANTTASGGFSFSGNSAPSFAFGGNNPTKPGVISFSANTSQQPQQSGGFNFGASAPAPAPAAPAPSGGFNFSGSTAPAANFNFSATPAQPAAPANNMFQFSASGPGGPAATPGGASNPFSMTASAQSGSRKIKRAVRKVRK